MKFKVPFLLLVSLTSVICLNSTVFSQEAPSHRAVDLQPAPSTPAQVEAKEKGKQKADDQNQTNTPQATVEPIQIRRPSAYQVRSEAIQCEIIRL